MPIIFQNNVGKLAFLPFAGTAAGIVSVPGSLAVDGWAGPAGMQAIFTRVGVTEQTMHQFDHMLGPSIYLYTFGDQIGQMTLAGLAFPQVCSAFGNPIINVGPTGFARVRTYYRANRVSNRVSPLKITINPSTTFETYLVGIRQEMVSPEYQIYQFMLELALVPDDYGQGSRSVV